MTFYRKPPELGPQRDSDPCLDVWLEEWEVSVVHPAELDICGDTAPGFEGAMLVCSKPLGHTGSTHQSDNGAAWTDTAANT